MPLFKSDAGLHKQAISEISQLIEELKTKKKEWKKFQLNQIAHYHVGSTYTHSPITGRTEDIPIEFEKLANRIRKMCIFSCSYYIAQLKRSRRVISKIPKSNVVNELKKIHLNLQAYYNNILISDMKKELQKEHQIEFKEALKAKKKMKYWGQIMANWDVDKMREQEMPWANEKDPDIIHHYINSGKQLKPWSGWRKVSLVKEMFKKYLSFQKNIGEILERYLRITEKWS